MLFTLLLLIMPGSMIEYLMSQVSAWLPWSSSSSDTDVYPIDKFVHAALFALSGFFLTRGWLNQSRSWLPLFLLLIAYAAVTEILQYFIPGRSASAADFLADGIGAAVGILLAFVFMNAD